jgi:drug/metabolite transporter (DMT)-like permease
MVTVFALTAALLYGSADFLGGAATRRAHVLSVLLISGTAGLAVVGVAALLAGGPPRVAGLAWGACAGAGLFGLAVVLTSLYPGVTVLLARFLLAERMGWTRRAGLALAAVGVLLVTV